MATRLDPLALLPLAAAAFGCAGTVSASGEASDAEASAATTAVVVVERTTGAGDAAGGEASARFVRMRVRAAGEDALRAVGANVDLPARGSCVSLSSIPSYGVAGATEPPPVVELVDVGAIAMNANGVETSLLPRRLPDVTDLVSGVVYARSTGATLLPDRTRYVVHVAGRTDIDAFDVIAYAPGDPSDVRVAGVSDRAAVVPGSSIDLSWEPENASDVVYVDVQPVDSGIVVPTVRCAFADEGHGSIPSAVVLVDEGTLRVHRLHREAFRVRGIDAGEMRFDFARVVAFSRH
jgi:hypothetical protein